MSQWCFNRLSNHTRKTNFNIYADQKEKTATLRKYLLKPGCKSKAFKQTIVAIKKTLIKNTTKLTHPGED